MSEQLPEPNQIGVPSTPLTGPIPGPVFKRAWLVLVAVSGAVLAVIIGWQVFG